MQKIWFALVLALMLAGCVSQPQAAPTAQPTDAATATGVPAAPTAIATPAPTPTAAATPGPVQRELDRLGIVLEGGWSSMPVTYENVEELPGAAIEMACKQGGYSIAQAVGKPALLQAAFAKESIELEGITARLQVFVISMQGEVLCVFEGVREGSGIDAGPIPVGDARVKKD